MGKKVIFCTPSLSGPTAPYIKSLEDSIPLIVEAGWEEGYVQEISNPYISGARAIMARKAVDAKADVLVFIDYDLSWDPKDLLTLIETEGEVVAGTYMFKNPEKEEYMGRWITEDDGNPVVRKSDGAIATYLAPAGFLKVTTKALGIFMRAYPELVYGDPLFPAVDLFNHGARNNVWWGEDFAFCDRWVKAGQELWTVPNLNINHHTKDTAFMGNFHEFLLRQDGGINSTKENTDESNRTC
jgi:hypothetical protein